MAAPRRLALRACDALALEVLLQSIEVRGLLAGTRFPEQLDRVRRSRAAPAKKFQTIFRLIDRISAGGILRGTDLQETWRNVRSAYRERVRSSRQVAG